MLKEKQWYLSRDNTTTKSYFVNNYDLFNLYKTFNIETNIFNEYFKKAISRNFDYDLKLLT